MAFFKFRKGGDDQTTTASPPESVEAMRKRAKHRLIGTAILVLIGVIGFPLLVDKQPRPIAVDIPIEIPDKAKVKPLLVTPAPVVQATASLTQASAPAVPAAPASAPAASEAKPKEDKPAAVSEIKAAVAPEPKSSEKTADKATTKPADEGGKVQALLEGKKSSATPAAGEGRFVVQVGAFADTSKAREVRLKLERAGLKTYTHVAETKDGRRIRVRVGPFATRAEADKAAEKIKKLDLPTIILTL